MPKAKLFMNGGSQAVRLPAEFRFEGAEVDIRKDPKTGEVILSGRPFMSWDEYFAWSEQQDWPVDFLKDRMQPEDDCRNPFETVKPDD